jgi:hypothetical protein
MRRNYKMKFLLTRTSAGVEESKPYEKAYLNTYTRVDTRAVDDPSKSHYDSDRETWYTEGTNHRVENGFIMRDFNESAWYINFNTLEELIEFKNEVGTELILSDSIYEKSVSSIEIYDDYRE